MAYDDGWLPCPFCLAKVDPYSCKYMLENRYGWPKEILDKMTLDQWNVCSCLSAVIWLTDFPDFGLTHLRKRMRELMNHGAFLLESGKKLEVR